MYIMFICSLSIYTNKSEINGAGREPMEIILELCHAWLSAPDQKKKKKASTVSSITGKQTEGQLMPMPFCIMLKV